MGFLDGFRRSPEEQAEIKVSSRVDLVLEAVRWDKDELGLEPPYSIMIGERPEILSSQEYMRQVGQRAVAVELSHT